MKYFLTMAAALMTAATACGQAGTMQRPEQTVVAAETVMMTVRLPEVPDALDFAGEAVPLGNYDTRESLQRELITTSNMHTATLRVLLHSRRYFAIIEPILERNNIPTDFKYLCVAESGLNPNIVSPAKAAGLWQIMPGTGRDFGLEVGGEVDERYHIEKATEVACVYLRKAYDRFGSWTLAAAAYNLGEAGVAKRIEAQGGMSNYYDIYMPDETRRYVFRILSFKMLFADPAAYGFVLGEGDYYKPLTDYKFVDISAQNIDWPAFAAEHGTTYRMLRELNHWIRDYKFANKAAKTYQVKVPNAGFRKSE